MVTEYTTYRCPKCHTTYPNGKGCGCVPMTEGRVREIAAEAMSAYLKTDTAYSHFAARTEISLRTLGDNAGVRDAVREIARDEIRAALAKHYHEVHGAMLSGDEASRASGVQQMQDVLAEAIKLKARDSALDEAALHFEKLPMTLVSPTFAASLLRSLKSQPAPAMPEIEAEAARRWGVGKPAPNVWSDSRSTWEEQPAPAHDADTVPAYGRCDSCGDPIEPMNPSWRHAGDHWQHRCDGVDPQAGHPGVAKEQPAPAQPSIVGIKECLCGSVRGFRSEDGRVNCTICGAGDAPRPEQPAQPSAEKPYVTVDPDQIGVAPTPSRKLPEPMHLHAEIASLKKERDELKVSLFHARNDLLNEGMGRNEAIKERDDLRSKLGEAVEAMERKDTGLEMLTAKLAAAEKALDEIAGRCVGDGRFIGFNEALDFMFKTEKTLAGTGRLGGGERKA